MLKAHYSDSLRHIRCLPSPSVYSQNQVVFEPSIPPDVSESMVNKYIRKVELQNERERDEKQALYLHEKLSKVKKESVECKL